MEITRLIFRSFASISWSMLKSDRGFSSSVVFTLFYLVVLACRGFALPLSGLPIPERPLPRGFLRSSVFAPLRMLELLSLIHI